MPDIVERVDREKTYLFNVGGTRGYDSNGKLIFSGNIHLPNEGTIPALFSCSDSDPSEDVFLRNLGGEIEVRISEETHEGLLLCCPHIGATSVKPNIAYPLGDAHRFFRSDNLFLAVVSEMGRLGDPVVLAYNTKGEQVQGYLCSGRDSSGFEREVGVYKESIEGKVNPGDSILVRKRGESRDGTVFFNPALDITSDDEAYAGEELSNNPNINGMVTTSISPIGSYDSILNLYAAHPGAKETDAVGFVRREGATLGNKLSRVIIEKGAEYVGKILPTLKIRANLSKTRDGKDLIFVRV